MKTRWTPDLTVGVAELEIDDLLSKSYLAYRAASVASGALVMLGRPADVRRPRRAWAALAIDAGTAAYALHRRKLWKTSTIPAVAWSEMISGAAVAALGRSAFTQQGWANGTAWTATTTKWRSFGGAVTGPRPEVAFANGALQLAPYLVGWRRTAADRQLARSLLPDVALHLAGGVLFVNASRRRARGIDERATQMAEVRVRITIATEEAALHRELMEGTTAALQTIRPLIRSDRQHARRLAEQQELRLRRWLDASSSFGFYDREPALDTSGDVADVEASVKRIAYYAELGWRISTDVIALTRLSSRAHNGSKARGWPSLAILARTALATLALRPAGPSSRGQQALAVADLATVAAVTLVEHDTARTSGTPSWAQGYAIACAATAGSLGRNRPLALATGVLAGAIRSALRITDTGPVRPRFFAAVDDLIWLAVPGQLAGHVMNAGFDQARRLTDMSTALALQREQSKLDTARLRYQTFMHDGVAQLLLWIGKDELSDEQLEGWIDREIPRLQTVLDHPQPTTLPLRQALDEMILRFEQLGLTITLDLTDGPSYPAEINSSILEIVNEALANVLRHTTTQAAHCTMMSADGGLILSVKDFDRESPVVEGARGFGTGTMVRLADLIGATIDWLPTPGGGTEALLTVGAPDALQSRSSVRPTPQR